MARFMLLVNHDGGVFEEPMDSWRPDDVAAHFDHYATLTKELTESGELVRFMALADPRHARTVRADGVAPPVVTDGPFAAPREALAGFNVFEVESEARALEIAARISAVPGPGGVPTQQPVEVRRVTADEHGEC
ncbi:YciI family protein [Streptomyces sp. NPDC057249]|uniref:YciI family protein n=1 Tax=Streptomyces sp. NPDC057249 TaxID=3346067 RepID=UPI003643FD9E